MAGRGGLGPLGAVSIRWNANFCKHYREEGAEAAASTPDYPHPFVSDAAPLAPPVVAVLVTHGVSAGLDAVLVGLAAQDYPTLKVLVLDTADDDELPALAGGLLPGALLRPLGRDPGYGAAANEVTKLVEGAGFFCFLHDEVVLDPGAIRLLVEETYRSNAGITGPKLVAWDEPRQLVSVGYGSDKVGEMVPLCEPGELDQEQHDAVRDVFCLSSACLLVRTDLFRALGGFDPAIEHEGPELDLCWRAHISGARVLVVPAAKARHPLAADEVPDERAAERRRLRIVLSSYSAGHLARVLPQYAIATVLQALLALVTGRGRRAGALLGAWTANLADSAAIRAKRAESKRLRQVPDHEIRRLQVRGSARLAAWLRGHGGRRDERFSAVAGIGRNALDFFRAGAHRAAVGTWVVVALAFLFGSRSLITGGIPSVGDLVDFPTSALGALRSYLPGWRPHGLGSTDPTPTALGASGMAGVVVFGAMGLARTLAILGPVALGFVGAWRLTRPFGVGRARIGGLVAYAAALVPYNSLAQGRWSALVAYGAAPWVLARIARLGGLEPFGPTDARPARPLAVEVAALGIVLAVAAIMAPAFVLVAIGMAFAVLLGSVFAGGVVGALRGLAGTLAAAAVAVLLHLPWSTQVVTSSWTTVVGVEPLGGERVGLAGLARFATGPHGAGVLTYALWIAAAVAVLVGRQWRLSWAVRGTVTAVVFLGLAMAADRGTLPLGPGGVEVLLVPVAVGLALGAACAGAASELDVRGARLSWRQPVAFAGALAVGLAALPALAATVTGRWAMASTDLAAPLSFLPTQRVPGAYRILWVGDPRALPMPGWELAPGLAYGLSRDGAPALDDRFGRDPATAESEVAAALQHAADGTTARFGALVGPLAVRYVIVPRSPAPAIADGPDYPPPPDLLNGLAGQLDLRAVDIDDALVVYENTQWVPLRAVLSSGAAAASEQAGFEALTRADLTGSKAVLPAGDRPVVFTGPTPGGTVFAAEATSDRWALEVGGTTVERRPAFGWANAFTVPDAGEGTLRYRTPFTRPMMVAVQAALWALAAAAVLRAAGSPGRLRRREERAARAAAAAVAAAPAPVLLDLDDPSGATEVTS